MKKNLYRSGIIAAIAAGALAAAGVAAVVRKIIRSRAAEVENECEESDIPQDESTDTIPEEATVSQEEVTDTAPEETAAPQDEATVFPPETTLTFDSFDGGGPEYTVSIDAPQLLSYTEIHRYLSEDHEELCGAGYQVIFTFTGLLPGITTMTISARSPVAENEDYQYSVTIGDNMDVTIDKIENSGTEPAEKAAEFILSLENSTLYFIPENNPSAQELAEKLANEAAAVSLKKDGAVILFDELPWELPSDENTVTVPPCTVLLTADNHLSITCEEFTGKGTIIGKVRDFTPEALSALFQNDQEALFWVEYSEISND